MPQYLLRINKRKWDKLDVPWLQAHEIQADPLGDLRINEGTLSVWYIEDDRSNLDPIITGLVATRQKFDKFEYGLFDQAVIDTADVRVEITQGNIPIESANSWHRDLIHLTLDRASNFVKTLFNAIEKKRLLDDEVKKRIVDAVTNGNINLQQVNTSLRKKIIQLIA
jgi:hypothetical protein